MKIKDKKTIKINMTETFENSLKKYFKKQKNIDYILKKTEVLIKHQKFMKYYAYCLTLRMKT